MTRKPCIKCLLRDMDESKEYEKLQAYLDGFEADIRVDDITYNERLSICRECEWLMEGICRKCGCFVEARALRVNGYCPHEHRRW